MIQQLTLPPSPSDTNNQPIKKSGTQVNPAPVNRPVSLSSTRSTPSSSTTSQNAPDSSSAMNGLSRYEQTQQFLKNQILSIQRKSKNLKDSERSILFQSIAALFGSVALGLAFIFFIFPLLVRFAGNWGNLSVFQQSDSIPPRIPAFAAPPEATQENAITLDGFGEPKSKIVVVKNGQQAENAQVDDKGAFSLKVGLNEGENTIALFSVDEAKNESANSKTYTISFDKKPPEVDWQTPEDKKVVKNLREQSVEVKGVVNEPAKVYLNDQFVANSPDGNFKTHFQLNQGDNTLILKVIDIAGNETVVERVVSFKP